MNLVYISDTNILIDFRHAGMLEVLFQLPFTLCCTDFVLFELNDFDHGELTEMGLSVVELDENSVESLYELTDAHNNSSLADVSCYFLAKTTGHPLLTGDGQLRKQAAKDGLQVHGALWLLDRLVQVNIVTKIQAAMGLQAMLAAGARLPRQECALRIAEWQT